LTRIADFGTASFPAAVAKCHSGSRGNSLSRLYNASAKKRSNVETTCYDIAIVGGGAAGLMTAISAARAHGDRRIAVVDGAKRLGAKILVSGGGRCNVTNRSVTAEDYRGGSRNAIRRVLGALTADETVRFFRELGVPLHEEENGKLFPDSDSARTVLDALLREAGRLGVHILPDHRVEGLGVSPRFALGACKTAPPPHQDALSTERSNTGFELATSQGLIEASRLVLATGGLSLPKTGSDGAGYEFARSLGHSITPTTPALAPFILEGDFHQALSGISHPVEITLRSPGRRPIRMSGAMLWTHFGASGPVILDASGPWHRARLEGRPVEVLASFAPGHTFESLDAQLVALAADRPREALHNALTALLPARVADAVLARLAIELNVPMAHLSREGRRRVVHALLEWPLPVRETRGYAHAEVTAGGVPLEEIDPGTMASRRCLNLFLVGEILDVDGRIGGFNFQWAWSSGWLAGQSIA
jgi:predicted flavoprotein YhiN